MKTEELYLLNILKSFLLDQDPGPYSGSWEDLFQLAGFHSVAGILGYCIMKYPNESNGPIVPFMRSQCLNTIQLQTKRAAKMKKLIQQMNETEIDHLLFKGYIVKDYYPVPELRTYGDIDFLIRPSDRQKSDDLMLAGGFVHKSDWEPVFSYLKDSEYYEIHTDVMEVDVSDKADYKEYFSHTWERAVRIDEHTWVLPPEDHFLYLLTHIAKHINGSGAGIRMYMDIAAFLQYHRDTLDWVYLQDELEKLGFMDFANTVLSICQAYLGVKSPIALKKIDTQVLEDFMEITMAGGIFGHVNRDQGRDSLKNQDRNVEQVSRVKTLMSRAFPSAKDIEKRYTYLQGRHWLLPVAWIHRFFRTKGTWENHVKEAHGIMNVDTEDVLRLRRLYKKIGL